MSTFKKKHVSWHRGIQPKIWAKLDFIFHELEVADSWNFPYVMRVFPFVAAWTARFYLCVVILLSPMQLIEEDRRNSNGKLKRTFPTSTWVLNWDCKITEKGKMQLSCAKAKASTLPLFKRKQGAGKTTGSVEEDQTSLTTDSNLNALATMLVKWAGNDTFNQTLRKIVQTSRVPRGMERIDRCLSMPRRALSILWTALMSSSNTGKRLSANAHEHSLPEHCNENADGHAQW